MAVAVSIPVAVNCWVCPAARVGAAGVTVTVCAATSSVARARARLTTPHKKKVFADSVIRVKRSWDLRCGAIRQSPQLDRGIHVTAGAVTDYWTVSVVPPLPPSEAAPIVVIPEFLPVANPVASIVATVVSLLVHVTPSPTTDTGVKVSVVVPLPRRPWRPRPQHCTRPPGRSAQLCSAPDVRAMALVIPVTTAVGGAKMPLGLPLPFWPY